LDDLDIDEERGGRPGMPVDLGRVLHEVLRYWRVVPIVGALAAVAGVVYASVTTIENTYTARAAILWEGKGSRQQLVTQVNSVKLPVNLAEVRRRLKLNTSIDKLRERISLSFDRDSLLVVVNAEAPSARDSAELANTLVKVFLEYQKRVERAQREEHLQLIEADLQVAQVNLANAREAQATFNKQLGLVDFSTERQQALEQALNMKEEAEKALRSAEAEEARSRKLAAEAKRRPRTRSQETTFVNQDQVLLAQKKAQLAEESARLAPDHPTILALKAQISTLARRARAGENVVSGGVNVSANAEYEALQSGVTQADIAREMYMKQHESFLELEAKARARLQDLERAEGQANELHSRVELAVEQVAALQKQRLQAQDGLRSIVSPFRIVTPAVPPEAPDEASKSTTVVRFPIAAMVLTVLGLVGYSLRGLRIHTAREAGYWANTPVIASSTWPRDPETLTALVDELSDHVPTAKGTTLVVGARPNEVPMAREIAYWLGNVTGWTQKALVGEASIAIEPDRMIAGGGGGSDSVIIGRGGMIGGGSALARTDQVDREPHQVMVAQAWDGPTHGPSLRRAARLADRVLVVVASGTLSAPAIMQLQTRLGRDSGVGLLIVGLDPAFVKLPDRVGPVDSFWGGRAAVA